MSGAECQTAIARAADLITRLHADGCNVVGFGEMGIGNTSAAALIMSLACDLPLDECVGAGTGLDSTGIARKRSVLERARTRMLAGGSAPVGLDLLRECGGFEIVMIAGAMLRAAELRMLVLVDGFVATAALLAARQICAHVTDYCVFAHRSAERGHRLMLDHLGVRPLLELEMRLGEGTGAALAYGLLAAAAGFLEGMASFESAGVSGRRAGPD